MADRRSKFTDSEDIQMLEFWEKLLKERNEGARMPCGNLMWEKYTLDGHSSRSPANLSSHFRKKIINSFWEWWDVKDARIMNVISMWDPEIDSKMKERLERKLKITIYLKSTKKLKGWERKSRENKQSKEKVKEQVELRRIASDGDAPMGANRRSQDTDVLKGRSPKLRRSITDDGFPHAINEQTPKKFKRNKSIVNIEASDCSSERSLRSKTKRIESVDSMPDPNEHNYTREIVDVKKQRRVRHSTREALGLPPILTPPKSADVYNSLEVVADASFHEEVGTQKYDPLSEVIQQFSETGIMDDTILINPESHEFLEGQGNNIDTAILPGNPSSTCRVHIPEKFREKTMAAAFACLKEFNERFDDDSFAEFRRREEAVVEDIMSVPEYLEAVAKIADKFTNRIMIQLREGDDGPGDDTERPDLVMEMMYEFIPRVAPSMVEVVVEMIEEKEPYIFFSAKDNVEYTKEMQKLAEEIWEKVRVHPIMN